MNKRDLSALFNEQTNQFYRFQDENIKLSEIAARIPQCSDFEEIAYIMREDDLMYAMCCLIRQEYTDDSINPETDAICTRFGGDEMIAVYPHRENDPDIRLLFCEYLDRYNAGSGKPYTVAASLGIYVTSKGEQPDFEELVKRSDALMYEEKKRRKTAR